MTDGMTLTRTVRCPLHGSYMVGEVRTQAEPFEVGKGFRKVADAIEELSAAIPTGWTRTGVRVLLIAEGGEAVVTVEAEVR